MDSKEEVASSSSLSFEALIILVLNSLSSSSSTGVFGFVFLPASMVIYQFRRLSQEVIDLYAEAEGTRLQKNTIPVQWMKPPHGYVKINFDGAYRRSTGRAGVGVVARDDKGRFVAAVASQVNAHSSAQAEALAVLEAFRLAKASNMKYIIIEGDSLLMIQILHQFQAGTLVLSEIPWRIFPMISEVLNLWSSFQAVLCQHVYREGNAAADKLANFCLDRFSCCWYNKPPTSISSILFDEVRGLVYHRDVA